MSNEERNEYMRNVKWTTALYTIGSLATVLLSLSAAYHGLENAIKDSKLYSKELFVRTDRKIDSIHAEDKLRFQSIEDKLNTVKTPPKPKRSKTTESGLFTEQWVNGKLTFVKL